MKRNLFSIFSLLAVVAILFASKLLLAFPVPLEFSGSDTTPDGKENVGFENWDDHIGRPTRSVTFDDIELFESTVEGDLSVKSGGDLALLLSPAVVSVALGYQGIGNVDDLTEPNVNSVAAIAGSSIAFNFLDKLRNGIPTFGTTEAVGGFVSTPGAVVLEVFDANGQSLGTLIKPETPLSNTPYFLGLVFPDDNGKQPIIARAEFAFASDGLFDGLVFTSVNPMAGEPIPPSPIVGIPVE